MKKNSDVKSIHIQVKAIELLGVELNRMKVDNILKESFEYTFSINIEQRIALEKNAVFLITTIEIYSDKGKSNFIGSIKTNCVFEVKELDRFFDKKNKKILFTNSQSARFSSIAISTTRGIMASEFRGTYLHNAILPLVDISSLKPD